MTTHKTVIGGLAAAALLTLAPLGAASAAGPAASPGQAVQVVGTAQRLGAFSLVLRMPQHRTITVYYNSLTPLLSRYGHLIFVSNIKAGHRLVVTGAYQGRRTFYAKQIRDTSVL